MTNDAVPLQQVFKYLADERKRKGMTQMHVAQLMGTTQSHVSDLERGATDPTIKTLARYAHAIGVKLEPVLVESNEDGYYESGKP